MILYVLKRIILETKFQKMSYLNQNAEVSYQDMKINADYIQIDWDKGLILQEEK